MPCRKRQIQLIFPQVQSKVGCAGWRSAWPRCTPLATPGAATPMCWRRWLIWAGCCGAATTLLGRHLERLRQTLPRFQPLGLATSLGELTDIDLHEGLEGASPPHVERERAARSVVLAREEAEDLRHAARALLGDEEGGEL